MKRWDSVSCDESLAQRLADELGLPLSAGRILASRGFEDIDKARAFLDAHLSGLADPFDIPGMADAVSRIWKAVDDREAIVIYGDFDVDGLTSTTLMVRFFELLGVAVTPFVPNRIDDGYGLTPATLKRCLSDRHPSLIITVDCGIGSCDAVAFAREQGVDVIITDHHEPSDPRPHAVAVVDPKIQPDGPGQMLAGVGVAFTLCHGLIKQARLDQKSGAEDVDIRTLLALVAIGTVADVVPLVAENRILVTHGLRYLNAHPPVGMDKLAEVARVKKDIGVYEIGFVLGPRINAAGRLGAAGDALELLMGENEDRAKALALRLDSLNSRRQAIERGVLKEAKAQLQDRFDEATTFGIVVGGLNWHPGVIGIVASRLCEQYRRPVAVVSFDEEGHGRGSCRSLSLFHLLEGLEQCSDLLVTFGGHHMAAGLQVQKDDFDAFANAFNQAAKSVLEKADLTPVQRIDAWVELDDVDWLLYHSLQKLAPFGLGHPRPILAVRGAELDGGPHVLSGRHLKFRLQQSEGRTVDAIAFGMGDRVDEVRAGPVDVVFYLNLNNYQGRESLQMVVQDFRIAK